MPAITKKARSVLRARLTCARNEYYALAHVDKDQFRMNTVKDLVFMASLEVDLYEDGESPATLAEITAIRRFIARWRNA